MVDCLVCGRSRAREDCHIVVLTPAEREVIDRPLDEYVYCKPCWGVLSDPIASPALISGIVQHHLRKIGVPNAEELSSKYRASLMQKAGVRKS